MDKPDKKSHPKGGKMKPYVAETKQGQEKFVPGKSKFGKFSTPADKLEARNANRSLKKSVRQGTKKDLRDFLG